MDKDDKLQEPNTIIDESLKPYYTDVFSPWETKEQFEIGKQVKGDLGTAYKVWVFSISSTGSLTITGVGFKPKLLTITATSWSATPRIVESTGYSDGNTTICKYTYQDTSAPNYVTDSETNGLIIIIQTAGTGTLAFFTSFNNDGFTINVTAFWVAGAKFSYIASK